MNLAQLIIEAFDKDPNRGTRTWGDVAALRDSDIVQGPEITDQGRWDTFHQATWRMVDGSFVQGTWVEGSTEYQDSDPDLTLYEVEAVPVTVIKYRRVVR